jgi:energy-coupling factor transport system ATP-binding protein
MDGAPREVFLDLALLRKAGLSVPETVLLLHGLNEDGFDLPLGALTVEECAQTIYDKLKEV